MNENSAQKTYFITGASRGVGKEICALLTRRGDHVISLSRTSPGIQESQCGGHHWAECDLADQQCVSGALADLGKAELPAIDGVFLNAARASFGSMAEMPQGEMEEIFRVNVFSHVELLVGLKPMLPVGSRIVCISTSASRIPAPKMGAYAASKLAMEGALQTMCMEEGWRLSILRPAEIDTEFAKASGVPDSFDAGVRKLDPVKVAQEAVACLEGGKVFANVGIRAKIIDAVVRLRPQWLMRRTLKNDA